MLQAWSEAGESVPLEAFSVDDLYDLSRPINAPEQLALYAAKVDAALAAGSAGVRVFADTTRLLTDHSRWESHASWEHQADQWMASGGRIAAMCAYDSRRIRPQTIASLHPARYVPDMYVPFSLHAGPDGLILEGSLDALCGATFGEALAIVSRSGPVTIDVNRLEFIDGHSVALLARRAQQSQMDGTAIRLVGSNYQLRRLWELLQLDPAVIDGVS
jgi:anti-anti-sigma regulatory factor